MFQNIIDNIWYDYDDDGNGYIDKREFFKFINDIMGDELRDIIREEIKGLKRPIIEIDGDRERYLTLEDIYKKRLENCFNRFDLNGDGVIEKEEMI